VKAIASMVENVNCQTVVVVTKPSARAHQDMLEWDVMLIVSSLVTALLKCTLGSW